MKDECHERLVAMITEQQQQLYSYIASLVYRVQDAQDVLQETNMVLWRKGQRALAVNDFRSWSFRVAYMQVLAYRKRNLRDRLFFGTEVLAQLAQEAGEKSNRQEDVLDRLHQCLEKLPARHIQMLVMRYDKPGTVMSIAKIVGKTEAAISQSLYRIRGALAQLLASFDSGRKIRCLKKTHCPRIQNLRSGH